MGATAAVSATALGGLAEAYSQDQAGRFEERRQRSNARMSEAMAADAIARGREQEEAYRLRVRATIGSQRASLAAQGIEIDEGTALQIQEETAYFGELDAITIRNNARREAWGYRAQAIDQRLAGTVARITGTQDAMGSLLSTTTQVQRDSRGLNILGRKGDV